VERRGQAIRVMITLVNWQQEEPNGCGGGRQLSMDGTSRVTGDSHARFCERLGVKFPRPTRRAIGDGRPYRVRNASAGPAVDTRGTGFSGRRHSSLWRHRSLYCLVAHDEAEMLAESTESGPPV
jgi:hypothetical protein